jgi:hypothetical protein
MTTTNIKQTVSDVDAKLEAILNPPVANPVPPVQAAASLDPSGNAQPAPKMMAATPAGAVVAEDITIVVSAGIVVLTGVKALLFWKPKWQTAIQNVIDFLNTFEGN